METHVCGLVDAAMPSTGAMQRVTSRLAAMRLVLMDGAHIKARLALNVSRDDVALIIKDDTRLSRLHQLL